MIDAEAVVPIGAIQLQSRRERDAPRRVEYFEILRERARVTGGERHFLARHLEGAQPLVAFGLVRVAIDAAQRDEQRPLALVQRERTGDYTDVDPTLSPLRE